MFTCFFIFAPAACNRTKQMLQSENEIFCLKKLRQNCWHISFSHKRPVITYKNR